MWNVWKLFFVDVIIETESSNELINRNRICKIGMNLFLSYAQNRNYLNQLNLKINLNYLKLALNDVKNDNLLAVVWKKLKPWPSPKI